jgi:hypothetical protein
LSGISYYNGVLLGIEWDDICREPKFKRIVPLYLKTNISGLQVFLWYKFKPWAGNGSCEEEIRKNFKDTIFEGINLYAPKIFWVKTEIVEILIRTYIG